MIGMEVLRMEVAAVDAFDDAAAECVGRRRRICVVQKSRSIVDGSLFAS